MTLHAVRFAAAALIAASATIAFAQPEPQPTPAAVAAGHQRLLPLEGGQNFRDLGGYKTRDGRTVRWGLLYRSGSMHFLTAHDHAYLQSLGIQTICDFRDVKERASEPVDWLGGRVPRTWSDDYSIDANGIGKFAPGQIPTTEQARESFASLYPQLLVQLNGQYRRMFAELLAAHAPLAFNCTAGKDRTGIAAALILTALGVPRETIVEDYLLTNRFFDPNKVVSAAAQGSAQWKRLPPGVLKAYMDADPSYIAAVFKVMDAHSDGMLGYLRDELGLNSNAIAKLRSLYTG